MNLNVLGGYMLRFRAWLKHKNYLFFRPLNSLISRRFSIAYYDNFLAKHKTLTYGDVDCSNKMVVFLIYPHNFVQQSHLMALRYFQKKGFAPVVVSNLPLSKTEKDILLPYSHLVIERPNYGYDFGGYRDGILAIRDHLPDLEKLALLNDSVWFPASEGIDWIDQVDALNVDFAGASTDMGIEKLLPFDFRELNWDYSTDDQGFHYGSFAICVNNRVTSHSDFLEFWQNYPITSDKSLTILRGEKGLTQWAINSGFTHDATADMNLLYDKVFALSTDETYQTLSNLIVVFEPIRREMKLQMLLDFDESEAWTETAKTFILAAVAAQGLSYTLPGFTLRTIDYPFIKKLPVYLNSDSSLRMEQMSQSLTTKNGRIIAHEIEEIRQANAMHI